MQMRRFPVADMSFFAEAMSSRIRCTRGHELNRGGVGEPSEDGVRAADTAVEGFLALAAARLAPRTVEAYRRDLAQLAEFLGKSPADATQDELAAYVAQLRADGRAAPSTATRCSSARAATTRPPSWSCRNAGAPCRRRCRQVRWSA
jgi:hypothetical protein